MYLILYCVVCGEKTIPSNVNGFGTKTLIFSSYEPYHSCPNGCIQFVSTSLLRSAMKRKGFV